MDKKERIEEKKCTSCKKVCDSLVLWPAGNFCHKCALVVQRVDRPTRRLARLELIEEIEGMEFVTGSMWLADLWQKQKDDTEVKFRIPKHCIDHLKDNLEKK